MLFLKLLRDLGKNRLSAITIVMITALGVMFWSGFQGIASNGAAITRDFYESCAMPDLFISGQGLTPADLRLMQKNGGGEVMGRNAADMTVPALDDAVLRVFAQALPAALNRPVVLQGSLEGLASPRALLLDNEFMAANGLKVGQELELSYGGQLYPFTILAGVRTPENIYLLKDVSAMVPDHQSFGYALVNEAALRGPLYGGEAHLYNQAVLTAEDPAALKDFIAQRFAGKVLSVTDRSEQLSASMVELEFSSMESIVGVFPTVFFLIAALISFTSLKRMVDKDRTAIGTMKALGVRDGAVLAHYTSYGLLFGALAAAVGAPLGLLIPSAMFSVMDMYFAFPPYTITLSYETAAVAAATAVLVSVAAAFWACRGVLALSPSVCMRPKSVKPGKKVLLERLPLLWERLDDIRKVVLRNLFRNKDRLVMSVFGITCSAALLFIAFGMRGSIDHLMNTAYGTLNRYDMKVYFEPGTAETQMERVAALPCAARGELVMETGAKVSGTSPIQKTAAITVVPDETRLLGVYEGRPVGEALPTEGCILSSVLAQELGVAAGDQVTVRFTGQKDSFTLPVERVMVQSFGQGIFVGQSAWRRTGEGFYPTAALLALSPGADRTAFQTSVLDYDFVLDAPYQAQLKASLESDLEISNLSISMMIFFAGAMAFIVLFNLGMLNFYEREREIATLKVVGFSDREVRRMAFGENYIFVHLGCVLGLLLGNLGIDAMLGMVETEHFTFTKHLTPSTFLFSIATLYLFAFLTNRFLGRYVRRLDMVSSLKGVE